MYRIALHLSVIMLLALTACDTSSQRAADEVMLQAGLGITPAAIVDPPQDTLPASMRRVWTGFNAHWLISPSLDLRFVALTDWSNGEVAVRNMETGEIRHVTNDADSYGSGFAFHTHLSPDGSQIAYGWWHNERARFELRLVDFDGGEPRILKSDGFTVPYAWSPDGRAILASYSENRHDPPDAVLVALRDGSVTSLGSFGVSFPQIVAFSPDGRFVAYDQQGREQAEERDVFVLRLDGRERIRVVDEPSNDYLLGWAPDGEHILYCSDRTGTPGVWLLPVREGRPAGDPQLVLPDAWGIYPVGFVPDGRYLYGVGAGAQQTYVATLSADLRSVAAPPTLATPRRLGQSSYPAWSPDGRYLAYIRTRGVASPSGSLFIRSLETGEIRELNLGGQIKPVSTPRWVPDGRSLLLIGGDATGPTGIYRVDVQAGRSEALVSERMWDNGDGFDLSPDARFLYYRTQVEGEDSYPERVFRKDLSNGSAQEVYRTPAGLIRNVAVSPDGASLAVSLQAMADPPLHHQIWVLPAEGGEARPVTPMSTGIFSIAWTPDSDAILYSTYASEDLTDQRTSLWRVAVDGGEPEPVGLDTDSMQDLRLHPDGRRLAFAAGVRSIEVWVMENFLPSGNN
jgi:Tol biopolymer transport system component